MKGRTILLLIVLILAIVAVLQSAYVVNEKQQAVVTQFGKPIAQADTVPGIRFKIPFIQKVNFFEKRYMEWDGDPNQVPTKDKKFIFVDTYARWQITDPLQFFKRLRNEESALSRLDDILDGETRNYIAKHNVEEAVRSSNRKPLKGDGVSEELKDSLVAITVGREKIQQMILKASNQQARELGIEILDFRFKRINYDDKVQDRVYKRMIAEREKIAEKFVSEGMGESSRINGQKTRELKTITSEAYRKAEEIRGKADAEAASIYAQAYDQSAQSRELYAFLKSLETLEKTANQQSSLILSTDSELYKYLKDME